MKTRFTVFFAALMTFSGVLVAQAETPPLFLAGNWALCQKNPGLPPWVCIGVSSPTGNELDYLGVQLRASQATGFVYFVDGLDINGSIKHFSGVSQRNDVNGTTSVSFPGGIVQATHIRIVEFSMLHGVFTVLESY